MEERAGKRRRLAPKWWGVLGAALGVAAFAAILVTGNPKAPFGDTLSNALTAFLGCVVAGWGITQAEIALEARKAAEGQANAAALQVVATHQQIDLQRNQLADADKEARRLRREATANREHADRTLRATIKQRLDAQAPNVIAHTEAAGNGVPIFQWRYGRMSNNGESDWTSEALAGHPNLNSPDAPVIDIRLTIGMRFVLLGENPARIDCDCVEKVDMTGVGWPLVLTPLDREASLVWSKVLSANVGFIETWNNRTNTDPLAWRPQFLVRDLGMNTGYKLQFAANLNVFKRDGDFLTLTPEALNFGETYAEQSSRHYEYFDKPDGHDEMGREMTEEQKRLWGIR